MTDADRREQSPRFGPLADYRAPAMPTRDTLQILAARARELLRRKPDAPLIDDARLRASTLDMLDEAAAPPACGPLIDELQTTLKDWLDDDHPSQRMQCIVLPPGDDNHVLGMWAETYGHAVLEAPEREALPGAGPAALPELAGDRVLVIPALESWFARQRDGLWLVRALLDRLAELDRRVVVGCNSWAWQYLVRAIRADAVLPAPLIFQPFDALRLHRWFSAISASQAEPIQFLDASSGDDILALDDDGRPHDRLFSLAARSHGIPWIAWRLWRRSLRRRIPDDEADEAPEVADDDAHTLWVIALDEFSLPGRGNDDALLVLHALLIHGPLMPHQLADVLPFTGAGNTLNSLLAAGILEHDAHGRLVCTPEAYPAIRTGLTTAGFPIAEV
ncbi:hypothetical protein [Salinisphaera hydrothermalis]|uniref:Uncharacterized protein n=1 Tax=Salinisphaera hydrothermalis (strain C41B8) TaxID=1304275 RepID=A0A084IH60_SALHC|nr:hypothetical protein [Salinisphaera hydrothermalis]KEZ76044.1 hypothetical protein C41B8_16839 [Salinisphaera hydrothermalis C41B8]